MGRTVTSLKVLDSTGGTTSHARVALTGDAVPESVFVKMAAQSVPTRLMGDVVTLAQTEVRFYTDLAPELGAGVPLHYGSEFDSLTGRFIIVLEDLSVGSCEFTDTLTPLDKDHAAGVVGLLAHLHGTFWDRLPKTAGGEEPLGWLWSASDDPGIPLVGSMLRLSARRMKERTSIPVEDGRFVVEHYPEVARVIDAKPHTVLHGDAHPGNCYFEDGQAGLLDWQVVRRGHPIRDVAYTIVTGMTTADRQAHQRDLLDDYRPALAAAGGPELDRDEMWTRYRQAAAYAFVAALITAGLGGMQSEAIALEGLRRAVAALNDLDAVAAIRQRTAPR
jgi:hypothetical protein